MIDLGQSWAEVDMGRSAVEQNIFQLSALNPEKKKVFYVVFTPPHSIHARDFEMAMRFGYPSVFYAPCDSLPDQYAWDTIMYSADTGLPIARKQNRPTP